MKIFLDNCLSPHHAAGLRGFAQLQKHEITHLTDGGRFAPDTPDPQWLADFFPLLMRAFHFDPSTGTFGNGPTWALPKDFTTAVMYCNVDLLRAAGVDIADI